VESKQSVTELIPALKALLQYEKTPMGSSARTDQIFQLFAVRGRRRSYSLFNLLEEAVRRYENQPDRPLDEYYAGLAARSGWPEIEGGWQKQLHDNHCSIQTTEEASRGGVEIQLSSDYQNLSFAGETGRETGYALIRKVTKSDQQPYRLTPWRATKEEAWEDARLVYTTFYAKKRKESLSEKEMLATSVAVDGVKRTGLPDYRGGRDISEQDLIAVFGMRSVQFGLWHNQKERQAVVNAAFESLMDLAEVTGLHPKAIGLNGKLALAFGARGHGGKNVAAAHYEPGQRVINLTRPHGAGSLAHEWFHALDHHLCMELDAATPSAYFATEQRRNLSAWEMRQGETGAFNREKLALVEAIQTMTEYLCTRPIDEEDIRKHREMLMQKRHQAIDRASEMIHQWLAEGKIQVDNGSFVEVPKVSATTIEVWKKHLDGMYHAENAWAGEKVLEKWDEEIEKACGKQMPRRILRSMESTLADFHAIKGGGMDPRRDSRLRTKFAEAAQGLDNERSKPYYTKIIEMGARAFSAWTEDSLKLKGGRSDYLVSGTTHPALFPEGKEREMIGEKMGGVVKNLTAIYPAWDQSIDLFGTDVTPTGIPTEPAKATQMSFSLG
jgi:hypothetical protein